MTQRENLPLVMIPGLACTWALFADQVPVLERDRQVIVADHTGHDRMQDIAADILAKAPARFVLAGLSMGGYISFEIMRQAPQRVERLCLMDTSARADTADKTALRNEALELVAAGKFMAVCHATLNLSIAASRHEDGVLKRAITDMAQDLGPEAWARQTRAIMHRRGSVGMLGGIACPTLVVVGEEDNLTPLECAVEMAEGIAGARLKVVADCGHMSSMERPAVVTGLLREWLRG